MNPREIKRRGTEGIEVLWEDGTRHFIASKVLRLNCPAADSRVLRERQSNLGEDASRGKARLMVVDSREAEQIRLDEIWAVGSYGLGMKWGDGHNTGIYPYALLYELGQYELERCEPVGRESS